jgi:proteic killer suppression protein
MQKLCTVAKKMRGRLGPKMAQKLMNQLALIGAAANLEALGRVPQTRCHEMKGDRRGQISIHLVRWQA